MKTKFLRLLSVLLLLTACLMAASCKKAPLMREENNIFTVGELGSYQPAPLCYEAKTIVQDAALARLPQGELGDILFYRIEGVDPSEMIASQDHELFCALGTTLPKLWEMDAEQLTVAKTESITYALATLSDRTALNALISAYQNGAAFSAADIEKGNSYKKYELKFESKKYAGIYYCLAYREYAEDVLVYQVIEDTSDFDVLYPDVKVSTEEYTYTEDGVEKVEYYAVYNFGKYLLHDRETDNCVAIDDTLAKLLGAGEES